LKKTNTYLTLFSHIM